MSLQIGSTNQFEILEIQIGDLEDSWIDRDSHRVRIKDEQVFFAKFDSLPKARKTAFYFLEEISSKAVNNSKLFELTNRLNQLYSNIIYFLNKRREPQKRVFRI